MKMSSTYKTVQTTGTTSLYSLDRVLEEADILVVLVDHEEFKEIDKDEFKEKVVIDTRGVWR